MSSLWRRASSSSNNKRTIWGNITEFVSAVQNYFQAKRVRREFDSNFEKVVAQTALSLLRKQRAERLATRHKFAQMSESAQDHLSGIQNEYEQTKNDAVNNMKKQLDEYEKQLEAELAEYESILKATQQTEERQQESEQQDPNKQIKVVKPIIIE
jgi:septin family protein